MVCRYYEHDVNLPKKIDKIWQHSTTNIPQNVIKLIIDLKLKVPKGIMTIEQNVDRLEIEKFEKLAQNW